MEDTEEEDTTVELEPGIYNFVPQIRDHIIKGSELPYEIDAIVKDFNREYDLDENLNGAGREKIQQELNDCLNDYDFVGILPFVKEGLSCAQKINNDVEIKPFPIIFIFSPYSRVALASKGNASVINVNELRKRDGSLKEKVVNTIAHESTHIFLSQLGKEPDWTKQDLKGKVLNFLWWEGLAKYVQPYPEYLDSFFENDSKFWVGTVKKWFRSDNNFKQKEDIVNDVINRESFKLVMEKRYGPNHFNLIDNIFEQIKDEKSADDAFLVLIQKAGFGYFIGEQLWKDRVDKGFSIKDLVMKGSEDMSKWVKEYE